MAFQIFRKNLGRGDRQMRITSINQDDKYFHLQTRIDQISMKSGIGILMKTKKTLRMHSIKEEATITVSRTASRNSTRIKFSKR